MIAHEFVTVRSAAEILGVSPSTLRNWDRRGRLRATRAPRTGYRLYRISDLERFAVETKLKRPRRPLRFLQ